MTQAMLIGILGFVLLLILVFLRVWIGLAMMFVSMVLRELRSFQSKSAAV